jgi:hypothetical protein
MNLKICIFFVVIWLVLVLFANGEPSQSDINSPNGYSIYEQLYKVDKHAYRKRNQSIYQKLYGNVTRTYEQMKKGCKNKNPKETSDDLKILHNKFNYFINFFHKMSLQLENAIRTFCMDKLGWHITTATINILSIFTLILLGLPFVHRLRKKGSVAGRPLPIRNALCAANVNIWKAKKNNSTISPIDSPQPVENIASSNSLKNNSVSPTISPLPRKEAEWELSADSICSEFRRLSISPEKKEQEISGQKDRYEMKPQYFHSEIIDETKHARRIRTTAVWKSVEEKTVYLNK